ncbi:hypothetical protein G3578_08090 [Brevibacillus sp. SYP-B805]|uniref:hypothetical protein n=1 Tax=Brevibacillus sp. SYP-B805 TaxID=1578199 RepID=UPI0013EB16C9|nr:hypothetical protein [Brevibacillus sp. SYP-B805]NGQ95125.1 hypothetical protein [Brevibacillus sp. SYP-B805]
MTNNNYYSKKASITIKFTEFEVPPMKDLLLIGRQAPVGPEAVRRMAEALSPEQFSIIKIDHPKVEAVLIRNTLIEMIDKEIILQIIMEEADKLLNERMVLRAELKVAVSVQREVDLA